MRWVYLSPHFDDIVLSCGGMVWEQVQAGHQVEVWTVCAGAPEPNEPISDFALSLHQRWGAGTEAVAARLEEDQAAVQRLGATTRYWDLPDCIYRRLPAPSAEAEGPWLVNGEDDLWQPLDPREEPVVERLTAWVTAMLAPADQLVSPLSLGNHVDHRLVRAAAERASRRTGCTLWYYPDYPYVARTGVALLEKTGEGWKTVCREVSREALKVWQDAVASYVSQLSTFFKDRADLDASLETYWQSGGGACLWHPGQDARTINL